MSLKLRLISNILMHRVPTRYLSSQIQKTNQPSSVQLQESSDTPQELCIVTPIKRRILVLSGFYKHVSDVPESVSRKTMTKCMDKFRIRMSLVIMAFCALGALSSIFLAKDVVSDIEEERNKRK